MSLSLMQSGTDGLDHLLRDQVTITQPQLIVVTQRQCPAAATDNLLCLLQTIAQIFHTAAGDRSKEVSSQRKVVGTVELILQ